MFWAVIVFRCVALVAFAAPMVIRRVGRDLRANSSREALGSPLPLMANVAAGGLFVGALIFATGSTRGPRVLLLAGVGTAIALTGAAAIVFSRIELGEAWSLVPRAGAQTGLVTTGPYRRIRHPIYLGLSLVAAGQAVAFSSGPAFLVVLCAVIPSFLWRSRVEEHVLEKVFGDRYRRYRARTQLIIPYVL